MDHGWNSVAYQILNPGFDYWFSQDGNATAGYTRHSNRWIIAGAPVCAPDFLSPAIDELHHAARRDDCSICFFGAAERLIHHSGFRTPHNVLPLGAQPVWDPRNWTDHFLANSSLRAQINRARNKSVSVQTHTCGPRPDPQSLQSILHEWLTRHPMPPLHFLTEPHIHHDLTDRRLFTAARDGQLCGYLVATPIPARNGWLIEQIIRHPRLAPNGTTELLLHTAVSHFAQAGHSYVTLGLAPLATPDAAPRAAQPWVRLLLYWLRQHGNRFYNFKGLENFKTKFQPEDWEPIYAFTSEPRFTPRTLWAIAAAFSHQGSPVGHISQALLYALRHEARQATRTWHSICNSQGKSIISSE